jgi:hypothetical protein
VDLIATPTAHNQTKDLTSTPGAVAPASGLFSALAVLLFQSSTQRSMPFGSREPCLTAPTRHPEANPKAAGNQYRGPPVLGLVISNLVGVARPFTHRQARYGHWLASQRLSTLLDHAIAAKDRRTPIRVDARYIYAGSDNRETQCAGGSGRVLVPGKTQEE